MMHWQHFRIWNSFLRPGSITIVVLTTLQINSVQVFHFFVCLAIKIESSTFSLHLNAPFPMMPRLNNNRQSRIVICKGETVFDWIMRGDDKWWNFFFFSPLYILCKCTCTWVKFSGCHSCTRRAVSLFLSRAFLLMYCVGCCIATIIYHQTADNQLFGI